MPLYEARQRFTLSEMVMISWRSQEQYWNMKKRMGDQSRGPKEGKKKGEIKKKPRKGGRQDYDDELVNGLPDRFFNEEGELDLRGVTGDEAVRYMNARSRELGLPLFPVIGGMTRTPLPGRKE